MATYTVAGVTYDEATGVGGNRNKIKSFASKHLLNKNPFTMVVDGENFANGSENLGVGNNIKVLTKGKTDDPEPRIDIKNSGDYLITAVNYVIKISEANKPFQKIDVWLGKKSTVDVYTKEDIYKTIKKAKKKLLKVSVNYDGPVEAPINKDQKVATLKVVYDQELVGEYDLLASKEIKKVNFFSRLLKSLNYLIWGDV